MDIALYVLAALLIVGGLVGAVLPVLPGIPMIFGGIWLVAAVDGYRHLGLWWLLAIGVLGRSVSSSTSSPGISPPGLVSWTVPVVCSIWRRKWRAREWSWAVERSLMSRLASSASILRSCSPRALTRWETEESHLSAMEGVNP